MNELKRRLTREELHELVWSTPVRKLAEQYGLSDRGFGKMCARHLVPVPPRGYWAKLEAGQKVKKTPLRKVESEALHSVWIRRSDVYSSPGVLAALAAAKEEKARNAMVQKNGMARQTVVRSLSIEDPGQAPHPSIASVVRGLRKAKPDAEDVIQATGVLVHADSRERAATILHNLARACDLEDTKLSPRQNGLFFVSLIGELNITLSEERRRAKYIPTAEETAEYERRRAKQARQRERGNWSFERLEAWPEFDVNYTGKLTLAYGGWITGIRKSWSDGKSQTVEKVLSDCVVGFKLIIAAKAEEARLAAEKERQRHIDEHRRYLAGERAKRDKERLVYLEWIAKTRDEIANLRKTVDAVPKSGDLPPEYARMIEWSHERLRGLEEQTSVEVLQSALLQKKLFPDPDPLKDPHDVAPDETGRS